MSIHEECGVFGVYDPHGDCARTTYYGLYALQHRGQEACGIATINDRELSFHKDVGLVGEVFSADARDRLGGTMAVGHVRYSTTGGTRRENAQPLTIKYVKGTLAVAHNGNLAGTAELRTAFEYRGAIFQTTTDSELIAYAIAQAALPLGRGSGLPGAPRPARRVFPDCHVAAEADRRARSLGLPPALHGTARGRCGFCLGNLRAERGGRSV